MLLKSRVPFKVMAVERHDNRALCKCMYVMPASKCKETCLAEGQITTLRQESPIERSKLRCLSIDADNNTKIRPVVNDTGPV